MSKQRVDVSNVRVLSLGLSSGGSYGICMMQRPMTVKVWATLKLPFGGCSPNKFAQKVFVMCIPVCFLWVTLCACMCVCVNHYESNLHLYTAKSSLALCYNVANSSYINHSKGTERDVDKNVSHQSNLWDLISQIQKANKLVLYLSRGTEALRDAGSKRELRGVLP